MNFTRHDTLNPHRIIEARRVEILILGHVIDNIDAPDKGHFAIHHGQLAMHAAQLA